MTERRKEMADYLKLVPYIKKWEGGFVNDPDDLGGATYMGVTFETYKTYCMHNKLPSPSIDSLRKMPDEHWNAIFKTMYWDRWKADEIKSQSVANILVDWVWASGVHGIKRPQGIIGVVPDGIVGIKTLAAINSKTSQELFKAIKQARADFVDEICRKRPANLKFKKGWLNRINDLTFDFNY